MHLFGWGTPDKVLAHPWQRQTKRVSSVLSHVINPFNDHKVTDRRSQKIMKALAHVFVNQIVPSRGLMGCLRDNEALAYWQGASTALLLAEHGDIAEDVAKIGVREIAPRGYQAMLEIDSVTV